jgi:hypothetical protein
MKVMVFFKILFSFVITITVIELFLRWSGTSTPALVTDDDTLGRILRPDTDVILLNEGFYMGRVNQGGYLGRYYPPLKPAHTIRIALVGDSYVAGFHLFEKYHFRTIMEKRLQELEPDSVQVLNFGFAGFNLEKMAVYYNLLIRHYQPDYVLFFIGTDDFFERDRKLGPNYILKDGKLVIDYSFRKSQAYSITKKWKFLRDTAFYSLHKKAMELYLNGETPEIVFDKIYRLFRPVRAGVADSVRHIDPERMRLCQAIVSELAQEKKPLVIFVVKNQLNADIRHYIAEQRAHLFDLSPVLDNLRAAGINPNYWPATSRTGHWNHYAHKAIGLYLASEMEKIIVPESP